MNDSIQTEPDTIVADDEPVTDDEPVAGRQCGRCRNFFPVAAGTHPFELSGWWACEACTEALLPARHGGAA